MKIEGGERGTSLATHEGGLEEKHSFSHEKCRRKKEVMGQRLSRKLGTLRLRREPKTLEELDANGIKRKNRPREEGRRGQLELLKERGFGKVEGEKPLGRSYKKTILVHLDLSKRPPLGRAGV